MKYEKKLIGNLILLSISNDCSIWPHIVAKLFMSCIQNYNQKVLLLRNKITVLMTVYFIYTVRYLNPKKISNKQAYLFWNL